MGEKLHVFRKRGAVWKAGLCKIEVKNGKRADGKDRAFTNEPCKSGAKYPTFYLFVPPYSILFWDMEHRKGETDALLYMLEDTAEQLLDYPNVKLFYYQNIEEIVTDLNNYKDYSHYSSDVNRYIVRSMREGTHQMTKENYRAEFQRMKDLAENFDYEQFFQ